MLTLTCEIETPLHRVPPGPKLLALALFSLGLFQLSNPWAVGAVCLAVALIYAAFGLRFARYGAAMLRPLRGSPGISATATCRRRSITTAF